MKPPHSRLTCRASNRFSPSIALWQHFVSCSRPFPTTQQRCVSTDPGAVQDGANEDSSDNTTPEADRSVTREKETAVKSQHGRRGPPGLAIRKMKVAKGTWHTSKVEASIAKNKQNQYAARQASIKAPATLLAKTAAAFAASEDYIGVVVQPMESLEPVRESSLPWCLKEEERTMAGIDRMAEEIDRFYHFSKPNPDEALARQHVIEQVQEHVRKILPNHSLEVFGSERTGLAFATSDIDLRLVKNSRKNDSALPPSNSQRTKAKSDLKKLYWNGVSRNGLSRHKAYILPQLRHARYPLIALQDRQSGLDIQIVLGNDTSLSREMIERYTTQYPYLRPLYAVVKTMFDVRGLTDVFRGGFGSYTLFMMIVASIRHNPSPRNDAAGGLLNFLRFYRSFDTSEKGLSIEPVCTFDKQIEPVLTDTVKHKLEEGKTQPLPPYMLSLRDPADETNDLGRKAIAIKHVQATFKKLCHDLDRNNVLNTRASLLGPLVGTSYMLNKEARFKLQNYGKRLSEQVHKSLAAKAKMIREQDGSKDEEKMSLQRDPDQWESLPA